MIFFFNNYEFIGGAENLIFNLIEYDNLKTNQFGLIGNKESYLYQRLFTQKINFLFIDFKEVELFEFNKSDKLILFNNFYGIERLICFKGEVLIWGILNQTIYNWNRFQFERKFFRKSVFGWLINRILILKVNKQNGIVFMDESLHRSVSSYFYTKKLRQKLIPIPVKTVTEKVKCSYELNQKRIRISYIGRGEEIWKIKPIKKVIQDLLAKIWI